MLKNYENNKKIDELIDKIDFFELEVFQKIIKTYLIKNCNKKLINDQKVCKLIEKIEKN